MYWFTGYIFDTFNELIQMFYARKDSPSVIAAVLSSSASRSRGARGRAAGDPIVPGAGGPGPLAQGPPRPPSLPSLGRMDRTGGLGLPTWHGHSLLSLTQVVLIKKRIVLEFRRLPVCLGPGSQEDGRPGWGTAGGQGSTLTHQSGPLSRVFTPTVRTSLEGPREGAVWSHSGPRSAPKCFERCLPRRVKGQADPAGTAVSDAKAGERGRASPAWVSKQLPVGSPRGWDEVCQGEGVFPRSPAEAPRGRDHLGGARRLWNPRPPAPRSVYALPTPARPAPLDAGLVPP